MSMKQKSIFMGIDVSKGYADFCILSAGRDQLEPDFQIDDQRDGHLLLKEKVSSLLSGVENVYVGVENTGGYERNWINALNGIRKTNQKLHVFKFNPKAVKYQIQSLMKTVVDDGISAYGIAIYMINNHDLKENDWENSTNQSEYEREMQLLYSMIQALIKQRTAKLNQLEKLLYGTFPEILKYVKNSVPAWVLRLIEKYPDATAVAKAKIEGLTKIKGISEKKANDLKQLAVNSVASLQGDVTRKIISQYSQDIMYLNTEIDTYKSMLVSLYKETPELEVINTVKGIADWTATSFLIEIGDYKRFKSTDQLASFYGVNPSFKQSGDGLYKVKMSKQGSAKMRAILYLIAHNLVMHNQYFRDIYAKHKAKGKKHNAVMGVLMHKVLRVLWGMLMTNTPFNEKIDLINRQKAIDSQANNHPISERARRYQPLSLDAPISRSNSKKRKAILTPQSSTNDESCEVLENSPVQT